MSSVVGGGKADEQRARTRACRKPGPYVFFQTTTRHLGTREPNRSPAPLTRYSFHNCCRKAKTNVAKREFGGRCDYEVLQARGLDGYDTIENEQRNTSCHNHPSLHTLVSAVHSRHARTLLAPRDTPTASSAPLAGGGAACAPEKRPPSPAAGVPRQSTPAPALPASTPTLHQHQQHRRGDSRMILLGQRYCYRRRRRRLRRRRHDRLQQSGRKVCPDPAPPAWQDSRCPRRCGSDPARSCRSSPPLRPTIAGRGTAAPRLRLYRHPPAPFVWWRRRCSRRGRKSSCQQPPDLPHRF